jgi:sulfatase maturation enzyme AslB (radical SAM superfamily)
MMDVLANVNGVGLSLDGNKETHETIRGSNTFAPVFDAIESLSSAGVPLKLTCVLTKITRLEDVRFVMETAGRYGIAVNFQPATICKSGSRDDNPLAMGKDDYDELFKSITQLKKESPEIIMNSFSGLRHLSRWPGPENIYCGAALIFCNIDPAGNIYGCIDEPGRKAYANILDTGLAEALRNKRITRCGQCWCGERVEANMILTPVLDAVKNYLLVRKSFD